MKIVTAQSAEPRYLTTNELKAGEVYEYHYLYEGEIRVGTLNTLHMALDNGALVCLENGSYLPRMVGDGCWRWRHVPNAELHV